MRIKAVVLFAALLCVALMTLHAAQARARGGGMPFGAGASSVGFSGGAMIGAHASPFYIGPYGYAPAYYHSAPAPGYSGSGYGYAGSGYAHGAPYPYAMGAYCWHRRQAIYGAEGGVVGVDYEYVCQ